MGWEIHNTKKICTSLEMAVVCDNMSEPMLEEREAAIHGLERDVRHVADLFQDVAILVQHQGTQIDHIESHMETAAAHTEHAAREIAVIERRIRRKRKRCFVRICVLSGFTFIGLMIIMFYDAQVQSTN